jgi:hypothetical protein
MLSLTDCYKLLALNEQLMREALHKNATRRIIDLMIHRAIILQEIVVIYEIAAPLKLAA